MVQVDQEFVKITAIKVIFDLFLMYGLTTFEENPEENADDTGTTAENTTLVSNSETPNPQSEEDTEDEGEGGQHEGKNGDDNFSGSLEQVYLVDSACLTYFHNILKDILLTKLTSFS